LGNVKAYNTGFSLFWWLGTLLLLVTGYFVKQYAAVYPDEMKIGFGIVSGIIGVIAGAKMLGNRAEDEGDGAGEGALFGAVGFAVLTVIFCVAVILSRGGDFF
jgi:hypothetical protein